MERKYKYNEKDAANFVTMTSNKRKNYNHFKIMARKELDIKQRRRNIFFAANSVRKLSFIQV
jgi:hypothetical protein